MRLGKTMLLSAGILLGTSVSASAQDFGDASNSVSRCVIELMDRGATESEARDICGLPDHLEITKLPRGEVCILPKKEKVVENMTQIPKDRDKDKNNNTEKDKRSLDPDSLYRPLPVS